MGQFTSNMTPIENSLGDADIETTHYWLYAPGRGASMWEDFYSQGVMGLAWEEAGDLSVYTSKEEMRLALVDSSSGTTNPRNDAYALWQFANTLKPGDVVFVKGGRGKILGRGLVTGDYEYDEAQGHFPNLRSVEWTHKGEWAVDRKLPVKTLTDITDDTTLVAAIETLFEVEADEVIDDQPAIEYPAYDREDFLSEVFMSEQQYDTLTGLLRAKKNVILQGAPGVGKTTAARLVLEAAKKRAVSPFAETAPFVETDGTTLRWDPRDMTNPLLGSVHDPIYQGAQKNLADSGVPEPKPGLVTDAHGGILFIDEIGEMDEMLQNKLLKVLEDKRAYFESAYYDPDDKRVPPYIRKLFEEGAPADFVLIGATTREPDHINPALRSRCAEIYFEPLTPAHIRTIVENAAERLHVALAPATAELISTYTIEGRKAINILADAYSLALNRMDDADVERIVSRETIEPTPSVEQQDMHGDINADVSRETSIAEEKELLGMEPSSTPDDGKKTENVSRETEPPCIPVTKEDIYEVVQVSRLYPFGKKKASDTPAVGRVFGLGVAGFLGSIIEIEAVAFPAAEKGKGTVRFNETAGSMAKDSVFNAASVMRRLTGRDLHDYDLHVNIIGGGNIDGPSAGTAILTAIVSAVTGAAVRQDVAVTGEISLQGEIRPVGGVFEKAYGARQAGISTLIIPWENKKDIPEDHLGLKIYRLKSAEEAFGVLFADEKWKENAEHDGGAR